MMINPNNLYIGLGTFVSEDTRYRSCLAGAFKSTCGSLGETPLDPIPDVIQKLEVSNSYITYVVETADEIGKGTSQNLRTRAKVVYSSGNDAYLENIAGTITYTSSDPSIASITYRCIPDKRYTYELKFRKKESGECSKVEVFDIGAILAYYSQNCQNINIEDQLG